MTGVKEEKEEEEEEEEKEERKERKYKLKKETYAYTSVGRDLCHGSKAFFKLEGRDCCTR
jgi:hypothetical protein